MIVVDTSSLIAIFREEFDAAAHARCIALLICAASPLEASMVLRGIKQNASREAERGLDQMLIEAGIEAAAVTLA